MSSRLRPDPDRCHDGLPVDPDLDRDSRSGRVSAPRPADRRGPWGEPRLLGVTALGGFLGGTGRYAVELALPGPSGRFPWPTFLINVSGSFLLALLVIFVLDIWPPTRYVRPFAAVGLLGGFTTFSTFAVEIDDLVGHGHVILALVYAVASVSGGLAAAYCGLAVGRSLGARRGRAAARRHAREESS